MNIEQEKSLALAELMGWPTDTTDGKLLAFSSVKSGVLNGTYWDNLQPYESSEEGLAQFAAILLKFPEVMLRIDRIPSFNITDAGKSVNHNGFVFSKDFEPTQANILDEILRMKGKWKEEWDERSY